MWFKPVDLKADADSFLLWGREFYKSAYGDTAEFDAGAFLRESGRMQEKNPRALLFAMLRDRNTDSSALTQENRTRG
jgi:hypothetical protein